MGADAEEPEPAHAYLPGLRADAGSEPQRGTQHSPGCSGVVSRQALYRRAGENEFRYTRTRRCWTKHRYGSVRQSTPQARWMKEESPGFNQESVNYGALRSAPARHHSAARSPLNSAHRPGADVRARVLQRRLRRADRISGQSTLSPAPA